MSYEVNVVNAAPTPSKPGVPPTIGRSPARAGKCTATGLRTSPRSDPTYSICRCGQIASVSESTREPRRSAVRLRPPITRTEQILATGVDAIALSGTNTRRMPLREAVPDFASHVSFARMESAVAV